MFYRLAIMLYRRQYRFRVLGRGEMQFLQLRRRRHWFEAGLGSGIDHRRWFVDDYVWRIDSVHGILLHRRLHG